MKTVSVPGIGDVKLVKSTRSRSIRLSVTPSGVRVSLPFYTPYAVGIAFVHQHHTWLRTELEKQPNRSLVPEQKVGKLHHLHFERITAGAKPSSRVTATKIIIKMQPGETHDGIEPQARALKAVHRALKKETEQLIPPRLARLAAQHGFSFRNVSAKQLKRRWGSCDSHHDIVINFFLMELPWELIDYVLLHELTHTEHLHHGPAFWARLRQVCPHAIDLRHQIKQYQPIIQGEAID